MTTSTEVPAHGIEIPPLPPMPKLVPAGAQTRSPRTAPPGTRRGVRVYGDSLMLQTWSYLQRIATDRGQSFGGGAYGGTALCDWLPAIRKTLRHERPAYLVLEFVGNNLTRCTLASDGRRQVGAPLVALYRRDYQRAIAAAHAAGTRVFLVGPPAMRERVRNADASGLRKAMRQLAANNAGVVYLDAHKVLTPQGYRARRPCLPFETAALGCRHGAIDVRAADGVHLAGPVGGAGGYSGGAWRFANVELRGIPNAP